MRFTSASNCATVRRHGNNKSPMDGLISTDGHRSAAVKLDFQFGVHRSISIRRIEKVKSNQAVNPMSHSNLVDFWRQDDPAWRDHRSTGSYRALQNANVPCRMGPLMPPYLRFSQRTCRHTTVPSRSWINPTAACTRPLSKRASSITHVRIHVQSSQCQQLFAKCLLLQRIVVVGSGGGVDGNHDQKLARYVHRLFLFR